MKKTLLLSALLASASAFAVTTGTLSVSNDTKTTLTTATTEEVKETKVTPKVVLDMKVKDTGFSFGGEALVKELTPLKEGLSKATLLKVEGNAFAKYELPEIQGVKTYVKGMIDHKSVVTGEIDLGYNYEGYKLGLNSKTALPVFKNAGELVTSTHTLSVATDKLSVLSDVSASVAVNHSYVKDAFKSVEIKANATYAEVKDLTVKGEVKVKYNHEKGEEYNSVDGLKTVAKAHSVLDTYKLTAEYKGVKDLKLTGIGEIKHLADLTSSVSHLVEYGLDLKAEYMPVENLTLTANGLFYGQHNATGATEENKSDVAVVLENNGYVKLVAGAKYAYKLSDKFTVTPEGTVAYTASHIEGLPATAISTLVLTPKVAAEYKVSEDLTFGGSVEAPVKFTNAANTHVVSPKFDYKDATLKTNFNLKYTW